MEPLTFVCWRWTPAPGYRSTFGVETVYSLREMVRRHYPHPHRFVCVTDRPWEIQRVESMPLWADAADIPSPIGRSYPSCYRRLKLFAPDAGEKFGPRVVSIDLDTVIVAELTPLFDRPEDFVIWGESDFPRTTPYCGSLWMLKTGTRSQVWTAFDPQTSPRKAWKAGCRGTDQGWISYILGPNEATWGKKDGVYSYRKHIGPGGNVLPANARVINWHGRVDPWSYKAQQIHWVKAHYPRLAEAVSA